MRHLNNDSGFSLLEVVLANGIIGIALLVSAASVVANQKLGSHHENITRATQLGTTVMEQLSLLPVSASELMPGAHLKVYTSTGRIIEHGSTDTTPGLYFVEWTVRPDSPETGITRIDVEVRWLENSIQRRIELSTFRS